MITCCTWAGAWRSWLRSVAAQRAGVNAPTSGLVGRPSWQGDATAAARLSGRAESPILYSCGTCACAALLCILLLIPVLLPLPADSAVALVSAGAKGPSRVFVRAPPLCTGGSSTRGTLIR